MKNLKKNALNGILIALLIVTISYGYSVYRADINPAYLIAILWILCVIVFLWFGNKTMFGLLDKRFAWSENSTRRFFLQLFLSAVYSLLCINGTYYLFKIQTTGLGPGINQMVVLNVYGLLFIIPVLSITFGIYFMNRWKKAQLQSNLLKAENLRSQLNTLKGQLDPHFLFNNLNVLSSLIELRPKTAQDFLDKFADVYRYVLHYKMEELVSVNTEIEFIEAYCYLLKIRFGDHLKIEINVDTKLSDKVGIPPLSLQLLVENAIKHNKITEKAPLFIRISKEPDQKLVVQNTYNPKTKIDSNLAKTGLESIKKRYEYLTSSPLEILQDEVNFTVRLPLLELF